MERVIQRRQFVGGVGIVALASLAGCSDTTTPTSDDDGISDDERNDDEDQIRSIIDQLYTSLRSHDEDVYFETIHPDTPDMEFFEDMFTELDGIVDRLEYEIRSIEIHDDDTADVDVHEELYTDDQLPDVNVDVEYEMRVYENEWHIYNSVVETNQMDG